MLASMGRARVLVRTLALCLLAAAAVGGCTNPGGRLPVDTPVYQFQAPDADEFAEDGDEDDEGDDEASDDSE